MPHHHTHARARARRRARAHASLYTHIHSLTHSLRPPRPPPPLPCSGEKKSSPKRLSVTALLLSASVSSLYNSHWGGPGSTLLPLIPRSPTATSSLFLVLLYSCFAQWLFSAASPRASPIRLWLVMRPSRPPAATVSLPHHTLMPFLSSDLSWLACYAAVTIVYRWRTMDRDWVPCDDGTVCKLSSSS